MEINELGPDPALVPSGPEPVPVSALPGDDPGQCPSCHNVYLTEIGDGEYSSCSCYGEDLYREHD